MTLSGGATRVRIGDQPVQELILYIKLQWLCVFIIINNKEYPMNILKIKRQRRGHRLIATTLLMLGTCQALADDGELVRKSMSKEGGNTPIASHVPEAEHAFTDMMKFYVSAQAADGTVAPVEYKKDDGTTVESRDKVKPLISTYIYGPVESVEGVGFVGHGKREAYGAVSLDDGKTWKSTNLSESADKSSSDVIRTDIPLFGESGAYPGDVINVQFFQAMAGNRALVVWPSRYCDKGEPNYALASSNPARRDAVAARLGIDLATPSPDDLYLVDLFGVKGNQGFVDYAEDKFEPNHPVGKVPFSCLWAARGVLVQGNDPRTEAAESSYMLWYKAERLTSGTRDVARIEAECQEGAGCAITWQEDPEGLRPGQGEGPGEGWSGAIANSQTDVWYSYLPWEHFDTVQKTDDNGATLLTLPEYLASGDTSKPQAGIPFAMPMRVTDNARCNVTNPQPYCNGSAIAANHPDVLNPLLYGLKDLCKTTIQIPTGKQGKLSDICVTEDGLPLVGNIAATRPRMSLHGYDSNKDGIKDSAFVVFISEESKGLGAFGFTEDQAAGVPCDPEVDDNCLTFDEGKNIWYYSFNMALTGDKADKFADKANPDSLVANLGGHGNILNQPEVNWQTGELYPARNTSDLWNFGAFNYELWNTEIARRGSLLIQDIAKAEASRSRLLALPSWKQGVMNQGGPADVMVRRILAPNNWLNKSVNPYAFRNMECRTKRYGRGKDGKPMNPYYPDGLCLDTPINLSATIPDTCTDSQAGGDVPCPQVDLSQGKTFGIGNTNPVLEGNQVEPNTTKILSWHQCPASFTTVSGTTLNCQNDLRTDASTLFDQSWYNPLDVAKGHRGYLDGDFVMMLYAWSPNWRLNAKGSDRYELYIRRSFDGGSTWGTLPKNYRHHDKSRWNGVGTVTCETFRATETGTGEPVEPRVCNQYAAGAPEQARNVTQIKSMRTTTLDPRFAATAESITSDLFGAGIPNIDGEDMRDPSRYFIVYETGDNTTTALGEPEPLDLFYSRAVMFGENYQVWAEEHDLTQCYPSNPQGNVVPAEQESSGFCNEFDQLDQGIKGLEASEASLGANSGGEFMYGVWAQLQVGDEAAAESDAMARRVWWIDDYIPLDA